MKTLYVLRHGQATAEEADSDSDHQRKLTRRGRADVRAAAESLSERAKPPTLVLTSSAARARQTAELCLSALPGETELAVRDDLYLAEPESYLAELAQSAKRHAAVLVVGHNPGLEALIYVLTQHSEHLATASLVEIELPLAAWTELSGTSLGSGRIVHAFRA
jgi:phosphohistidine phosphatase